MKKYLPLVNLGLRGLVLVSKFAFIFILANKLSVKELGEYGLFSSTVIYCLYFLGLDFYVYSNREVAKTDRVNAAKYINNQFFVYMVVATISILPLFLLSTMNIINRELFFYFCLILYLEHISQEMTRLLIVIGMPIIASITLFLRVALWTYVVTLFLYVFEDYSQLSFVLLLWLCGSLCSVIFATYIFRKNSLLNFSIGNIDYLWIIKGLKLAMPFLITTLIMRAVFVFD
jgi:O-antigen/teichoic acid export membrane protein